MLDFTFPLADHGLLVTTVAYRPRMQRPPISSGTSTTETNRIPDTPEPCFLNQEMDKIVIAYDLGNHIVFFRRKAVVTIHYSSRSNMFARKELTNNPRVRRLEKQC